jgi:heme/copper-type cytochrome/quinol oxidase subunit 4
MLRKRETKKKDFLLKYGLWIAIILLIIDWAVLSFLRTSYDLSSFANIINVIIAAGVAIISFFCYTHVPKTDKREKTFFFFLFVAFICRVIGEILWIYYDSVVAVMPPFSFADLAWFCSNLIILLDFEYKLRKIEIPHKKTVLAIFALILLVLSGIFIWGIYLRFFDLESGAWWSYLVNQSYVLFDLFILVLIFTPLYTSYTKQNDSFYSYFFLNLGFICFVVYDFLFAKMYLQGTYDSGGRIEILYFFAYFLIFCAFYFKYEFLKGWKFPLKTKELLKRIFNLKK